MKLHAINILIVPKMSKLELDMHKSRQSRDEVIAGYHAAQVAPQKIKGILDSHARQKLGLSYLTNKFLPHATVIAREHLTVEQTNAADLVISFGGDEHTKFVSHFIRDTLLLPLNADPVLSTGALTTGNVDDVELRLERHADSLSFQAEAEQFRQSLSPFIESWTRLEVHLNGKAMLPLAISEIFLGEDRSRSMSRYSVSVESKGSCAKKQEDHKTSGILVATLVGTSVGSWYHAAAKRYNPIAVEQLREQLKKQAIEAAFVVREPSGEDLPGITVGGFRTGDTITVRSYNDERGVILIDPEEEFPFNYGDVATVSPYHKPLNVLNLKKIPAP